MTKKNNCSVCGEALPENSSPDEPCEACAFRALQNAHWSHRFIRDYETKRIVWRMQYVQSLVRQMEHALKPI